MIVVDPSVLAPALADDGPSGDLARARLAPESLVAPELIDLEVVSAFRGQARGGLLTVERVDVAVRDLAALPMERVAHHELVERCWQLQSNLTVYDAAYVALAELLDVTLVTADSRIARSPGPRCAVEVLTYEDGRRRGGLT